MKFKNFRSEIGLLHVAGTSGHVAQLDKDWVSVPDILWSQAYAMGATSEDIKTENNLTYIAEKRIELDAKEAVVRAEHKAILRQAYLDKADCFDDNGQIRYRKIISLLGPGLKLDYLNDILDEIVTEEDV